MNEKELKFFKRNIENITYDAKKKTLLIKFEECCCICAVIICQYNGREDLQSNLNFTVII